MGGASSTSSTAVSNTFQYECDSNVAQFVKHNYFYELCKHVEDHAKVESVSSGGQNGIVNLRSKVALNTSSTLVADCKKKLDEYFERFLSFEEKLQKIIPRHELDAILNSSRRQCDCNENTFQNSIRITGIKSDVTAIIKRLRSAQEPKPSSRSSSRDSRSSINQSNTTSNVTPSPIVSTSNSGAHRSLSFYNSGAHRSSSSQRTLPASSSKATTPYHASQQADVFETQRQQSNASAYVSPPTPPLTRSSSIPCLDESFQCEAPDYAVARFIKHSSEHKGKLDDAMKAVADVTFVENGRYVGYRCQPVYKKVAECVLDLGTFCEVQVRHEPVIFASHTQASIRIMLIKLGKMNLRTTYKDFESTCKQLLAQFLNQYSSRKHNFNPNYLKIVRDKNPQLFWQRSRWENESLYVQWYDNRLIIAGPKDDVFNKEKEVQDSLNAILQMPASTVVKIPADSYSIALFLKQSSVHMLKLTNAFSQVASVKLWQVALNDGSGRDRQMEYRFTPTQNTNLTDFEFEAQCKTILDQFLSGYSAEKKFFNRDHLLKAKSIIPAKFFEKQSSSDDLYVEWRLDQNRLLIVGPENNVKQKLKDITKYLNEAVPRNPRPLKLPVADVNVAKFLDQSTLHSTRLQNAFKALATVKVYSNQRRADKKFMEYHFKALPSVTLSEDEFKVSCETTINKFLENYSSNRKFFNRDHLKRAKSIVPEFFQTRAPQEEISVKWPLDKSCVIVTGLSNEVKSKIQEITDYIDQMASKYLRSFHEFELDSPSITIAKFVKEKKEHFDGLKNAIEDADVWIGPGKFSLHFKATIQLTQADIPEFENMRKSEAVKFFRNFGTWRQRHPREVIDKFRDEHSELLSADNTDWKLEITNDNEVVLTGVLPQFSDHKAKIIHLLENANKEEKQLLEKSASTSRPTPAPRKSLKSTEALDQVLMYQPRGNHNRNILKHIFQSPMDLVKLQNVVGPNVRFQPFPNPVDPEGIKFTNSGGINITKLQQNFRMFFLQFAQCSIQFLNPEQKNGIIHVVYNVGQQFRVPDRMMSIQEKLNVLFIIGRNEAISFISKSINGFVYRPQNIDLQFYLPPEERRSDSLFFAQSSSFSHLTQSPSTSHITQSPSSSPLSNSPSSSRRYSSSSSHGSESTSKKTKIRQKKAKFEPNKKKDLGTKKQLNVANYLPKRQYGPILEFVLNKSKFFDELQSRCAELCTVTKYPGRSDALKATAKKPEINHKQFSKDVVEKMEEFLSSISFTIVPLDADFKDDFEQIKTSWLEKFYDSSDWVVMSWQETDIEIKGFEEDVQKYADLLMHHMKEVTETRDISEVVSRKFTVCGVLTEVNRRLKGKMVISCSEDGKSLVFKGKALFYDMSVSMLNEVGHLVESEPLLEKDKLKALEVFLSKEEKMENEEFIREKFASKNIKCVLQVKYLEFRTLSMWINKFRKMKNRSRFQHLVFHEQKVKPKNDTVFSCLVNIDFFKGEAAIKEKYSSVSKTADKMYESNVSFNEILDQSDEKYKYLALIGYPGSGKTTLAKRLAESKEILCFYIDFMNSDIYDSESLTLKQLLQQYSTFEDKLDSRSDIFHRIIDDQKKVAIIIDGFDRLKRQLNPKCPSFDYETPQKIEDLVSNLCRKHYLPNVSLIIASRPHSVMTMPEILRPKATYFIKNLKFHDMKTLFFAFAEDRAQELWDEIDAQFHELLDFCLNPMMLQCCIQAFLCLSTSNSESVTLSQIFGTLIENLSSMNNIKNKEINKIKTQLGVIAFNATMASTVVISMEQLKEQNLTMEKVQDLIVAVQGYYGYTSTIFDEDINLYFSHQLLQEYFTAYHIVENLSLLEPSNELKTQFFSPQWLMVRKFVSGLLLDAGLQTKGLLNNQPEKVILAALTTEMHQKGSKFLDELIVAVDIAFPQTFSKAVLENTKWKSLLQDFATTTSLTVHIKKNGIKLISLHNKVLKTAESKILEFFAAAEVITQVEKCDDLMARFVLKYFSDEAEVKTSKCDLGLKVTGKQTDIDRFGGKLKNLSWKRTKISVIALDLLSLFDSSSWKDFIRILEHDIRCTVNTDTSQCKSSSEEEILSVDHSQSRGDFSRSSGKETSYGDITITVCNGDITADDCDIIVNGVIDRSFDLSRGSLSSALLKRAGSLLQIDCNQAEKYSRDIRFAKGRNLLCDHVIHVVTPHKAEELTSRIEEILQLAELLKAGSVALPTLGAGGVGISSLEVACAMSTAFEAFARSKPHYVKKIKVVVYEQSITAMFQKNIVEVKGKKITFQIAGSACGAGVVSIGYFAVEDIGSVDDAGFTQRAEMMSYGKQAIELLEAKVKSSLKDDKVRVFVLSDNVSEVEKAKKKIVAFLSEKVVTKTKQDDIVAELEENDLYDIYQDALKYKATIDYDSSKIVVKGLAANVSPLYDVIQERLFELREASTMSKIAVWKWAGSSNHFTALPLRVSRAIEKLYEKNKNGSHRVTMFGSDLVVDFSRMSFDFKLISGKLKREDSDQLPSAWGDMEGKLYKNVTLDENSVEYHHVMNLFNASSPSYKSIISIERVQNPLLYKQYQIRKNEVERRMRTKEPVDRELFHGTASGDVESICSEGFDKNFAGKNATVYGRGCYFAVKSSYSVKYTGSHSAGIRTMFLARVITGDYIKGHHSFRATPGMTHSGDAVRKYDSVVDDEANPSMFIVFKDSSVYPSYLISFY